MPASRPRFLPVRIAGYSLAGAFASHVEVVLPSGLLVGVPAKVTAAHAIKPLLVESGNAIHKKSNITALKPSQPIPIGIAKSRLIALRTDPSDATVAHRNPANRVPSSQGLCQTLRF